MNYRETKEYQVTLEITYQTTLSIEAKDVYEAMDMGRELAKVEGVAAPYVIIDGPNVVSVNE